MHATWRTGSRATLPASSFLSSRRCATVRAAARLCCKPRRRIVIISERMTQLEK